MRNALTLRHKPIYLRKAELIHLIWDEWDFLWFWWFKWCRQYEKLPICWVKQAKAMPIPACPAAYPIPCPCGGLASQWTRHALPRWETSGGSHWSPCSLGENSTMGGRVSIYYQRLLEISIKYNWHDLFLSYSMWKNVPFISIIYLLNIEDRITRA